MSFNPYSQNQNPKATEEDLENNDTQMSGNQAFMAFLTKTEDEDDE